MKKKLTIVLLALLLLAGAGLGGWYGWQRHYENTHVFVEGEAYPADLAELNLRGQAVTVERYLALRAALPDCEIRWDVPFQDTAYPDDTTAITVSRLSFEDVERLEYLPELRRVDAADCRDYEALAVLEALRPECEVSYKVAIGDQLVEKDAAELTVPRGVADLENLKYLPALESVFFPDTDLPAEVLLELRESYPRVSWEKQVFGALYPSTVTEFDFSTMPLSSVEELEAAMAYFPELETLTLIDCGLDNETLADFRARVPYKVIWTVKIGRITVRTDATTLMPYQYGYSGIGPQKLRDEECGALKYLEDMVCIDLGHMALTDISFAAYMPDLEYFLICDNHLTDISPLAGHEKLKFLEIFNNRVTDISALASCPALEDVNMCYNPIPDMSPLYELENLNNIWLAGMYVDADGKAALEAAHPDAHIEYYVEGSVGKGWRKLPNYFAQRDLLGMWYLD